MDADSVVAQVQRRIELQSPEDLTFLVGNVRKAARARVDEAFPHVEAAAADDDDLRNQIEALVNEYIDKTFALAAPNLSINGLPVPSDITSRTAPVTPEPTYEPFDTRKRQRVADLIAQEERLLEEVAALKRSVPARAAAEHAEHLAASLKRDQEALVERVAAAADVAAAVDIGLAAPERQTATEAEYRKALEGLARLKRDMPAVVAKMERAKVAGEYVLTERR
ncbi:hypothetical protein S40288_08158 [Stachybotrys chartarum IBT 40288]|nr:hypothetical protein S40288_08158 [Stachybotrys chartarum IBT 40288]